MKDIESRTDIERLVNRFYAKIRTDETLGIIFDSHIPDDKWPEHLAKLADFWETNLFGVPKFKGNPTQKHYQVDANLHYTIDQKHFGRWLQLWFETIDECFEGALADRAKNAARRMSTVQYLAIWQNRPDELKK